MVRKLVLAALGSLLLSAGAMAQTADVFYVEYGNQKFFLYIGPNNTWEMYDMNQQYASGGTYELDGNDIVTTSGGDEIDRFVGGATAKGGEGGNVQDAQTQAVVGTFEALEQ